jgi:hypothetical protein
LFHAALMNHVDICTDVIRDHDVEIIDQHQMTMMDMYGNVLCIASMIVLMLYDYLLDHYGVDMESLHKKQRTAWFCASFKKSILVTQLLLDPIVNVQHEGCDGWTLLLLWASACNSVDVI